MGSFRNKRDPDIDSKQWLVAALSFIKDPSKVALICKTTPPPPQVATWDESHSEVCGMMLKLNAATNQSIPALFQDLGWVV